MGFPIHLGVPLVEQLLIDDLPCWQSRFFEGAHG